MLLNRKLTLHAVYVIPNARSRSEDYLALSYETLTKCIFTFLVRTSVSALGLSMLVFMLVLKLIIYGLGLSYSIA